MKSSRRMWATAGMCLLALAMVTIAADWAAPLAQSITAAPAYPQRNFSDLTVWDVASVLGPDRILIRQGQRQQTVKLIGVAAAQVEPGEAAGPGYESQAVEFLANLLGGERVYVLGASSGAAELSPVKVFRVPDGLYVNLELVRQGYSRMDRRGLTGERKLFEIYQRRAQQAGKGLWSKLLPVTPATTLPTEVTVYITKSGKKYHRAQCRFLAKSNIPISLSQAKKRGFTPCKVCKPPP